LGNLFSVLYTVKIVQLSPLENERYFRESAMKKNVKRTIIKCVASTVLGLITIAMLMTIEEYKYRRNQTERRRYYHAKSRLLFHLTSIEIKFELKDNVYTYAYSKSDRDKIQHIKESITGVGFFMPEPSYARAIAALAVLDRSDYDIETYIIEGEDLVRRGQLHPDELYKQLERLEPLGLADAAMLLEIAYVNALLSGQFDAGDEVVIYEEITRRCEDLNRKFNYLAPLSEGEGEGEGAEQIVLFRYNMFGGYGLKHMVSSELGK